MNAPRTPNLPQWKIDLVREAMKILEGEKGASCNGRDDCKENPLALAGRYRDRYEAFVGATARER